ncbi:hypothetical protein [Parapedobacter indicus]|uniref:Uncharacterized protein n=2 Tax=Parapedobacter indicus TaxID=1477437 RepID=A0A1I3KPG2_9SPHI|nr:hypothetical protein [Parapedobacter indicus]PPL01874.1 hypothetical protein CLV26_105252 [Parapedobacter indicus]SFI74025.1 hypothetical protein SAMN05444682_105253 [Parapedobacter indicus]
MSHRLLSIAQEKAEIQTINIMQQKKDTKAADAQKKKEERDRKLDEEIEQTFPASDPPSYSQPHNEPDEKEKDEDE